jgi:lipopolysaccharide transport system permease protein
MGEAAAPAALREVTLTPAPVRWGAWWDDVRSHREVFVVLAKKEFQTRYKRASLGILWAVAIPLLQGGVMAFVFSRVSVAATGRSFGLYVIGGTIAWAYFSSTISTAATAIVDGSGLTDKVWFPRILLAVVPAAANAVGLAASLVTLLVAVPLLDGEVGLRLLLLVPGCALLIAFTTALSLVLSGLHVYFRDTKFLVQATLLVWIWVTPIVYRASAFEGVGRWTDLNPMTGVVALFHQAVAPDDDPWGRAVLVSIAATVVLGVVGGVVQRRHDRLFVDRL